MCCGPACDTCGAKQPDLPENATDVCSRQIVRSSRVGTLNGTLPCMVKYIPTEESKAQQLAYDTEQGLVGQTLFGQTVEIDFDKALEDEEQPWYKKVASAVGF